MNIKFWSILCAIGLLSAACSFPQPIPDTSAFTGPSAFWDKPKATISTVTLHAGSEGIATYEILFHCSDPLGVNSALASDNDQPGGILGIDSGQTQPGNTIAWFRQNLHLSLGAHTVQAQCQNVEGDQGPSIQMLFNVIAGEEEKPPEAETPVVEEVMTATFTPTTVILPSSTPTTPPTPTATFTSTPTATATEPSLLGPLPVITFQPGATPIPPPN